jgi:hypothetical protein
MRASSGYSDSKRVITRTWLLVSIDVILLISYVQFFHFYGWDGGIIKIVL